MEATHTAPDEATAEQIVERGRAIYEHDIRPRIDETLDRGKRVVIDVKTGGYVMDADPVSAAKRARTQFPDGEFFSVRVGFPTTYRIGGHRSRSSP